MPFKLSDQLNRARFALQVERRDSGWRAGHPHLHMRVESVRSIAENDTTMKHTYTMSVVRGSYKALRPMDDRLTARTCGAVCAFPPQLDCGCLMK